MGELSQIVSRLIVDDKEAQAVLQRYGITAQMLTKNLDQLEKSNQRVGSGFAKVGHEAAQARMSLMSLNYIVSDLPYGFRGIANNMDMSVQSLVLLIQTSGGAMGALKALGTSLTGGMGILFAFTAITSAIQIAQYGIMSFGKSTKTTTDETAKLAKEIHDLKIELGDISAQENVVGIVDSLVLEYEKLAKLRRGEPRSSWSDFWKNFGTGISVGWENIKEEYSRENDKFTSWLGLGNGMSGKSDVDTDAMETSQNNILKIRKELSKADKEILDIARLKYQVNEKGEGQYRSALALALTQTNNEKERLMIQREVTELNKKDLDTADKLLKKQEEMIKKWDEERQKRWEQGGKDLKSLDDFEKEMKLKSIKDEWAQKKQKALDEKNDDYTKADELVNKTLGGAEAIKKKKELYHQADLKYQQAIDDIETDHQKKIEDEKHRQQKQEIQYVNALGEALHRVFSKSGNELIGFLQRAVEIWKLILMLDNAKGGASAMDYISTGVGILSFMGKTSTGGRSDQLTESSASYSLAKSSPRGFSSSQIIMPERMRVDVDNGVAFVTKWAKYDKDKHIN